MLNASPMPSAHLGCRLAQRQIRPVDSRTSSMRTFAHDDMGIHAPCQWHSSPRTFVEPALGRSRHRLLVQLVHYHFLELFSSHHRDIVALQYSRPHLPEIAITHGLTDGFQHGLVF